MPGPLEILSPNYDHAKYCEYRNDVAEALGFSNYKSLSIAEWMLLLQQFQYGHSVADGAMMINEWRAGIGTRLPK